MGFHGKILVPNQLRKNMNEAAGQVFQGLVDRYPKNPTFRLHLGAALLAQGQKQKAREHLEQARQLKPAPEDLKQIQELLSKAS